MAKKEQQKFIWCPVCMVHTYHKKEGRKWVCSDWNHEDFLRFRTDPWMEKYRKGQLSSQIPARKQA